LFSEMDTQNRNIMTLEEPVEYQLPGIRQTEIKEGGVINFADGVRSILRQDPDVIFIGEIRDEATAKMALRSAMTGHLVIATIHTYDCFGVPARLIDLGLHPSLLAGHIVCAVSQRLIRKICTYCNNNGCDECYQTGYKGRCAVVEILPFNDQLDELIAEGGNRSHIKQYCQRNQHISLWHDGQEKLAAGIATESELKRALGYAQPHSLSFF
jgi:type IV pilus assembly protein PilB